MIPDHSSRKIIAISGYRHQLENVDNINALIRRLRRDGCHLFFNAEFGDFLKNNSLCDIANNEIADTFPENADAVISIGGDGTFLRTSKWVGFYETPILGINTGHLGYLACFSFDNIDLIADALLHKKAITEKRSLLQLICDNRKSSLPDDLWPYALNEITIHKEETSSMLTIHAKLDQLPLADYMADGLIVATPTGSTAYNLSAGGPIVEPTFNCMLLTPIAPHSLTLRPLVLSPGSILTLSTTSRSNVYRVSLDNRSYTLPIDSCLHIKTAPFHCNILRPESSDFSSILRSKLHWGQR